MHSLSIIKSGITKGLQRIDFPESEKPALVGETDWSYSNMTHYLGLLEKHTDEVLMKYLVKGFASQNHPHPEEAAVAYLAISGDETKGLRDPHGSESHFKLPEIPLVSDADSDDDENAVPLTLQELHLKASQEMPSNGKKKSKVKKQEKNVV